MPEVLWTDIHNIAHEVVNKTIPKKSKKAKWLSEELYKQQKKRKEGKGQRKRTSD